MGTSSSKRSGTTRKTSQATKVQVSPRPPDNPHPATLPQTYEYAPSDKQKVQEVPGSPTNPSPIQTNRAIHLIKANSEKLGQVGDGTWAQNASQVLAEANKIVPLQNSVSFNQSGRRVSRNSFTTHAELDATNVHAAADAAYHRVRGTNETAGLRVAGAAATESTQQLSNTGGTGTSSILGGNNKGGVIGKSKEKMRMTFYQRVDDDVSLFDKLHEMLCSKSFTLYAANEMQRAYCMMSGFAYTPLKATEKEKIATSWAPIPVTSSCCQYMNVSTRTHAHTHTLLTTALGESCPTRGAHTHTFHSSQQQISGIYSRAAVTQNRCRRSSSSNAICSCVATNYPDMYC